MQFPHPFLLDGTVTNAMEMIGNILEHGADIFMVQEEYILKYKLHGPPTQYHPCNTCVYVCAHVLCGCMSTCCSSPLEVADTSDYDC